MCKGTETAISNTQFHSVGIRSGFIKYKLLGVRMGRRGIKPGQRGIQVMKALPRYAEGERVHLIASRKPLKNSGQWGDMIRFAF